MSSFGKYYRPKIQTGSGASSSRPGRPGRNRPERFDRIRPPAYVPGERNPELAIAINPNVDGASIEPSAPEEHLIGPGASIEPSAPSEYNYLLNSQFNMDLINGEIERILRGRLNGLTDAQKENARDNILPRIISIIIHANLNRENGGALRSVMETIRRRLKLIQMPPELVREGIDSKFIYEYRLMRPLNEYYMTLGQA